MCACVCACAHACVRMLRSNIYHLDCLTVFRLMCCDAPAQINKRHPHEILLELVVQFWQDDSDYHVSLRLPGIGVSSLDSSRQ